MIDIEYLKQDAVGRRTFINRMFACGLGGAVTAFLAGCGGGSGSSSSVSSTVSTAFGPNIPGKTDDQVVFNFLYSFELLQAALYLEALNQATSSTSLTPAALVRPLNAGTPNPVTGNTNGYVSSIATGSGISGVSSQVAFAYLTEFAYVHSAHAAYLKNLLGSGANPIIPGTGYYYEFPSGTTYTQPTNGITKTNPGGNLTTILNNIRLLQELMVRVYLGAIVFVDEVTTAQNLGTIYSTECRNAALIQVALANDPGPFYDTTSTAGGGTASLLGSTDLTFSGATNAQTDQYEFEKWDTPTTCLGVLTSFFGPNTGGAATGITFT